MINPYQQYLTTFFETVISLRHAASRINQVLIQDVEIFTREEAKFYSGAALIISDWTGPTDNGWDKNYSTGVLKEITKENYASEVEEIISRECCLAFSQSFEALEKFLKDCIYHRINSDNNFKNSLKLREENVTRESIRGGDELFKYFKKAGGNSYKNYTKKNNKNIKFKELWSVLSEARHSITHSSARIKSSKIKRSQDHLKIFNFLFNHSMVSEEIIRIKLTYKRLDHLLKSLSEFGFQIFKILSVEERLNWDILK